MQSMKVILLQDMIEDKKWPTKYGNAIEKFLTCQVLYMLQIAHMAPDVIGKMTSIHKCTCT